MEFLEIGQRSADPKLAQRDLWMIFRRRFDARLQRAPAVWTFGEGNAGIFPRPRDQRE
jgi:hypothetical protein